MASEVKKRILISVMGWAKRNSEGNLEYTKKGLKVFSHAQAFDPEHDTCHAIEALDAVRNKGYYCTISLLANDTPHYRVQIVSPCKMKTVAALSEDLPDAITSTIKSMLIKKEDKL